MQVNLTISDIFTSKNLPKLYGHTCHKNLEHIELRQRNSALLLSNLSNRPNHNPLATPGSAKQQLSQCVRMAITIRYSSFQLTHKAFTVGYFSKIR